jgi:hypothetical protein
LVDIGDLRRVPDQPHGLITAPGQQALQQQRNLPVPARDHYPHDRQPTDEPADAAMLAGCRHTSELVLFKGCCQQAPPQMGRLTRRTQ